MRIKPVLRCCVLAGLLASPFPSYAVGLGRLTLQSGLGQALQAEIELTSVQPGELDTLSARLADQATYARNRIDYAGTLTRVRIALDPQGGRPILRLSSTQPVNDPFLDLLIEINWASGRIVREYTFLLDPPGYAATAPVDPAPAIPSESLAPPVTAAPAPARAPASAAGTPAGVAAPRSAAGVAAAASAAGVAAAASAASAPKAAAPPGPQAKTGQYGPIRRGETLAAIAAKVKPQGVTLEQMLSALYRSNAQAFEGKNMNRLRTGPMLIVPNPDDVSVSQDEARKEIRVQAADWRSYRERLAASIGSSETPTASARAPSGGRITTAIDEKSAPAAGSDRLKLSKGEPVTGTISGRGGAAARAENAVAGARAVDEANARVVELERQLKNMQRLLELKQPAMAGQQLAANDARGVPKAPAAPAPAATATPAPAATPSTAAQTVPPMAATPSTPLAPVKADAAKAAAPKTDAVKADASSDAAKSNAAQTDAAKSDAAKADVAKTDTAKTDAKSDTKVDSTKTDSAKADASKSPTLAAVDSQKSTPSSSGATTPAKTDAGGAGSAQNTGSPDASKARPSLQAPAAQPETSMLDELLGNSVVLIGLGSALLLGLVWALLARRRRNSTTKFEDSIGASTDLRTSTVFGNTGGGVVNTGDNSLVSDFSREGMGNIDTGEVDPIAEAEVYLAYGRDNQAEEILRDALTKTPDRQEIRLKLLEIYAQQNKAAAFEGMASELFNATDGKGEMWNKAAQIGRTIDADNPLYAAKDSGPAAAGAASMMDALSRSPSRLDRMSDSNLRVAEAVEKSAAETGFGFTDQAKREVFVMPPALTPAEAARSAAGSGLSTSFNTPASYTASTHQPAPSRDSLSPGAATLAAPIGAAAAASVAAASASRGSAVRDRAPLDFKLDSGPEESADAPPATMDFVTLDGPITLTGSSTLTGPSTLSGVTLASPASDMWGEKPQSTLTEQVDSGAAGDERPVDLPERDFAHEFTKASVPDTLAPMTRSGTANAARVPATPSTTSTPAATSTPATTATTAAPSATAGLLDLDKLDLEFEPDLKAADDGSASALDGQWHDAATKLDLAKAYHEMGDVDGAREILQEVTQEGDDEQKKEAQAFLSKLRP